MANTICPSCKQAFDPDEGSYTEDGLICGDCQDQRVLDGTHEMSEVVEGTFLGGFLAGFFGGCIGLIIVRAVAKGEKTKQGALVGFASGAVLGIVMNLLSSL